MALSVTTLLYGIGPLLKFNAPKEAETLLMLLRVAYPQLAPPLAITILVKYHIFDRELCSKVLKEALLLLLLLLAGNHEQIFKFLPGILLYH